MVVVGGATVGRLVGKLGSPPGPQPGQVAAPSVVVLHPAAAIPAVTSNAAARPAFTPWDERIGPDYALSDESYCSDPSGRAS